MYVFVKFLFLLVYVKSVLCIDCQNGLTSAECLREEVTKLRLDLRPITSHLPANTQQYLPFGSLESDWNRLLQLESLLPEDHHLRQQLTKSFLLLVHAVREALEYQLSKTTTIRHNTENGIETTSKPEDPSVSLREKVVDVNDKDETNESSDETREDANKSVTDEVNKDKNIEEHHKHMVELIEVEEKAKKQDENVKGEIKEVSKEIDSKESDESKHLRKDVETFVVSSEENSDSESVADFNAAKAEGLIAEDFNAKNGVHEVFEDVEINSNSDSQDKISSENLDERVTESVAVPHSSDEFFNQEVNTEEKEKSTETETFEKIVITEIPKVITNTDSHGDEADHATSVSTTTAEDLEDLTKDINFPSINQDDVLESFPKNNEQVNEASEVTRIYEDKFSTINNEETKFNDLENIKLTTMDLSGTTTNFNKEDRLESTKIYSDPIITEVMPDTSTRAIEFERTIDEELRDIIFPGVEETSTDIPPVIFTDTTIGVHETEQLVPAGEIQSVEHFPHTLENVDVFGGAIHYTTQDSITGLLKNVPNKVARHTTHKYHPKHESNTEPIKSSSYFYTEMPIIELKTAFEKNNSKQEKDSTEASYNMDDLKYYTEGPEHQINDESSHFHELDSLNEEELQSLDRSNDEDEAITEKYHEAYAKLNNEDESDVEIGMSTVEPEVEIDPEIKKVKWNLLNPKNPSKLVKNMKYFDEKVKSNRLKTKTLDKFKKYEKELEKVAATTAVYDDETLEENINTEEDLENSQTEHEFAQMSSEEIPADPEHLAVDGDDESQETENADYETEQVGSNTDNKDLVEDQDDINTADPEYLAINEDDEDDEDQVAEDAYYETEQVDTNTDNKDLVEDQDNINTVDPEHLAVNDDDENKETENADYETEQVGHNADNEDQDNTNTEDGENKIINNKDEVNEDDKNKKITQELDEKQQKSESDEDLPNDESLPTLPISIPGLPIPSKPKITLDTLDALNRIIFGKAYDPTKGNKYKIPQLGGIKPAPVLLKPLEPHKYIPMPKLDLKLLQPAAPLVLPPPPPPLLPIHKPLHLSRTSRFAHPVVNSARTQEDDLYRWFFSKFRSDDAKNVAEKVKRGEDLPIFEYKGSRVPYKVGDKHSNQKAEE